MWYRVFKYWVLGCWGCTWFDFSFIESIDFGVGLYSCGGERMNDGRIFFSESGGCSEEVAESVLQSAFGLSMRAIWQHMTVEISDCHVDYPYKVKLFFSLMSWLMLGGHLKLASESCFLDGSVQDQLHILRKAWPDTLGEDDLDGFGIWFLTDAPAGVVWIGQDGSEFWT